MNSSGPLETEQNDEKQRTYFVVQSVPLIQHTYQNALSISAPESPLKNLKDLSDLNAAGAKMYQYLPPKISDESRESNL